MAKEIQCPHCQRKFSDNSAVYQHIKVKHGGKGKAAFRSNAEPSYADLAIQAFRMMMTGY